MRFKIRTILRLVGSFYFKNVLKILIFLIIIQITTTSTRTTLIIEEVYIEDGGIFSVKLENVCGTAKCSANLLVEG